MRKVFFCLVIIFLLGDCKPNYSVYQGPKKAQRSYTGKKNKDKWMDDKRDNILQKY